jgi:hypothetical protein
MAKSEPQHEHQHQVSINLDTTPVLYTDSISINTNEDGVVLDVMQRLGNSEQMKIVTRIGMSRIQAKKFLDSLGKLILLTEENGHTGNKN